jgi:hypothetical protein
VNYFYLIKPESAIAPLLVNKLCPMFNDCSKGLSCIDSHILKTRESPSDRQPANSAPPRKKIDFGRFFNRNFLERVKLEGGAEPSS